MRAYKSQAGAFLGVSKLRNLKQIAHVVDAAFKKDLDFYTMFRLYSLNFIWCYHGQKYTAYSILIAVQ